MLFFSEKPLIPVSNFDGGNCIERENCSKAFFLKEKSYKDAPKRIDLYNDTDCLSHYHRRQSLSSETQTLGVSLQKFFDISPIVSTVKLFFIIYFSIIQTFSFHL